MTELELAMLAGVQREDARHDSHGAHQFDLVEDPVILHHLGFGEEAPHAYIIVRRHIRPMLIDLEQRGFLTRYTGNSWRAASVVDAPAPLESNSWRPASAIDQLAALESTP